jgi:tetratricopeptide (TPR) repeat protein
MNSEEQAVGLGSNQRMARDQIQRAEELYRSFVQTRNLELLNKALGAVHYAVVIAQESGAPEYAFCRVSAERMHITKWDLAGDPRDLEEILSCRSDVDLAVAAEADLFVLHSTIVAMALQERYALSGAPDDLREAIRRWKTVIAAEPGSRAEMLHAERSLAGALVSEFENDGDITSLNSAVSVLRSVLRRTPEDDPQYAFTQANLCHVLNRRFDLTLARNDIDEAVSVGRDAFARIDPEHPDAHVIPGNASDALVARAAETGSIADLEQAIKMSLAAVELAPEGQKSARALSGLGGLLVQRYETKGSLDDLNEAVRQLHRAVSWRLPDGGAIPAALTEYSVALRMRHEALGTLSDLEQSVIAGHEAVASPHLRPRHLLTARNNLGLALMRRAERFSTAPDATEAIDLFRLCADPRRPDRPALPGAFGNLATALELRFHLSRALPDLEEAARIAQTALDMAPQAHIERELFLGRLCTISQQLYVSTKEIIHLDKAIDFARQAVTVVPVSSPSAANAYYRLGMVLSVRAESAGAPGDLPEALSYLAKSVHSPTATLEVRRLAACALGRTAAKAGYWGDARDAYDLAVDLQLAVGPQEPGADALYQLERFMDLASDAAACHLQLGDVEGALQAWEKARAGFLAGELQSRHPDLDKLECADPDRARRLVRLLSLRKESAGASSHQIQKEVLQAISEVRERAGFESFLGAPPLAELRLMAQDGPIVVVTNSTLSSYAIIITKSSVSATLLPGLSPRESLRQMAELEEAQEGHQADEGKISQILCQLSDSLVAPVLGELRAHLPSLGPGTKVHWCLSSWLGLLPVQAALVEIEATGERAPAFTLFCPVFSFSLQGLECARLRDQKLRVASSSEVILAVALPETEGLSSLPGVLAEVSMISKLFDSQVRPLTGPDATRAAVMAQLPASAVAHLACHGISNPARPASSGLMLFDHSRAPMTVRDVLSLELPYARFAYLSACSTANPGYMLSEQAIHLASAFQVAGFTNVIGTLWRISDSGAVMMASSVYEKAASDGISIVSTALQEACSRAYERHPDHPSQWAAFVCYGI